MPLLAGIRQMITGLGHKMSLDPGNAGNPPGNPPVQYGSYEYIQSFAFQGIGHYATDIADVPPGYTDWGQMGVNVGDASGLRGGGYYSDPQVDMPVEQDMYFDQSSGLYYDLGNGS